MRGQWIGNNEGTNPGYLVLNLDEVSSGYEGYAYLIQSDCPVCFAPIRFAPGTSSFDIDVPLSYCDRETADVIPIGALDQKFPGRVFPDAGKVSGACFGNRMKIQWSTSVGTSGVANLERCAAGAASKYKPLTFNWDEFKSFVSALDPRRHIFRGQEAPWPLRTRFHRSGRADLIKIINQDLPALVRSLSAKTRHFYDVHDPDQRGAFFHLIQHHGYPTTLLDWSYSPFVAAFFAFRGVGHGAIRSETTETCVRVFVFDQREWRADFQQIDKLHAYIRHFSIIEFIAIDNDRMLPQQALSSLTNMDDIEAYIAEREAERSKRYLRVIDIPISERSKAMADLSMMGITAGSMLPGLDGACEELRERLFPAC